ncbi:MAG TPA: MgtC/SapB family protein [Vicinamibacterales bacterium]|nr:MgtC/SapB family protein [Vicinamibacterales bacterium]
MELTLAEIMGVAVAILGGAAVGVERQRSGHATGPQARLGGIRTFTLLGTLAGIAGYLISHSATLPAGLLIAGALGLVVAGYVRASKKDIDATTEVAAVVVIGAGALAGLGQIRLAAALVTLTVLVLAEKPRLHDMVARLDEPTMLAAARFAVMSAVILPLLPQGPFGPGPGFKPRELWMLVLLFSGMSFVGYIAQRATGAAGYPLTGLLGGLVSSTSVTLTFARLSHAHPKQDMPLATGAVAASAMLFLRVAVAVSVLNAALLPTLARYLAAPFAAAAIALLLAWRSLADRHTAPSMLKNPLQFRAAIEMALLFQIVLFAVHYMRAWIGETGLLATGFVLGLTDVDALTLSMSRSVTSGTSVDAACRAIATGIVANSLMKAGIAMIVGSRRFKWQAGASLLAMAAAGAAVIIGF